MRRRFIWQFAIPFAVLALAGTGCQSTTPAGSGSGEGSSRVSEFEQGETVVVVEEEMRASKVKLDSIYFDFDRWDIRSDAKPILQKNARAIRSNELDLVVIEGNCDERGSEEFNLALGDRRAATVKQYLVDLGVPASRLRTVSFGESKPAVMGHTESAWRWNRRTDFTSPR